MSAPLHTKPNAAPATRQYRSRNVRRFKTRNMRRSTKVNAPPRTRRSALVVEVAMEVEEVVEEVSLNMVGGREMLMVVEAMVMEEASVEVDLEEVAVLEEVIQLRQEATPLLQVVEEEGTQLHRVVTRRQQEATQHLLEEVEVVIPPPQRGGSLYPPLEVTHIPTLFSF